ncbi:hypothetical protein [Verrucomicrobium spinosum]|uniref:hypothetical protein n=1 Tax=Verrucomicrobium spinosum TaxID=2736 RepID=UPI000AD0496E|nr:hypothetical protein [Verrucomicrobium spinosum]
MHEAGALGFCRNGDEVWRLDSGAGGWEHHGAPAGLPGLEVVAEGTSWRGGDSPAHWTATVFPGPAGNIVFNAATIYWPQALSSPPGHILPWSHWSRPHGWMSGCSISRRMCWPARWV